MLLWAWLMALFLAVEVLAERRREAGPKYAAAFRVAASSIVLLFSLILMAADLFGPTNSAELLLHPEGLGMNIALQTVEMAVHPPLVFSAYAACLMLFSASMGRLVADDDGWRDAALPWAKVAGALLLAGIAVGAVWAYYELGWGGFWVWDPVETASLFPFIAVIAFLHADRSRGAREGALQPFLGTLSFVFVLLASFITRTGGLWGSSVHTYGSMVSGSLEARLVTVLTGDMGVMGLFAVIIVLFAICLVLSYRTMLRAGERGRVSAGVLATVASLLIYAALLLLLLIKNTGLDQGANFIEITEKTTLLSFPMALLLLFGLISGPLGRRNAARACAAVAAASVALAAAALLLGTFPWLAALAAPPAGAVIGASAYRIAMIDRAPPARWLGGAGGHLVHAGIAIVLLSFIISSTMQAYLPEDDGNMSVGSEARVGGHTIILTGLSVRPWTSSTGEAGEERAATFVVRSGGPEITVTVSNLYKAEGSGFTLVRSGTAIINGAVEDLYLDYGWVNGDTAMVQARVVPLVSEVWAGFVLATAGMVATLFGRPPRERPDDLF